MSLTDRTQDIIASLGATPGETDSSDATTAPTPAELLGGDSGIVGEDFATALLGDDGDAAGLVAPDNEFAGLGAPAESDDTDEDGEFAGVL